MRASLRGSFRFKGETNLDRDGLIVQRSAPPPPRSSRPRARATRDLSAMPMLTHFTRSAGTRNAIDNLASILREGVIHGASRLIRGKRPVVCLLKRRLANSDAAVRSNRRRYEPFGVALDKRYAFAMGARPVLYMPWREARLILAEEEWWRVVAIDLERNPPIDWSFEREWRVAGELPLPARAAVALVETGATPTNCMIASTAIRRVRG